MADTNLLKKNKVKQVVYFICGGILTENKMLMKILIKTRHK